MARLLAGWHLCVPVVNGPEKLVFDEVGDLNCARQSRGRDAGRSELAALSHTGCQSKELLSSGSIQRGRYLQLRMESARMARVMEKLTGLNAVNWMPYDLM